MTGSLSAQLCLGTVDAIVDRLGLTESLVEGDQPFRVLRSPMMPDAPVGSLRVFRRPGVCDLLYVGLTVPMIGLDSHMLFAFTPTTSAVPHFTLDSVAGAAGPPPAPGETPGPTVYAFHLDLIPKLDLGAHLGYLRHCFEPLTPLRAAAQDTDGLSAAHLSPTQYAVMSAWMLVHRADESAFAAIPPHVAAYRDHWFALVEAGVPDEVLDGIGPQQIDARDRANRAIVFDPTVDPVWSRVARLIGDDEAEVVRRHLATPLT